MANGYKFIAPSIKHPTIDTCSYGQWILVYCTLHQTPNYRLAQTRLSHRVMEVMMGLLFSYYELDKPINDHFNLCVMVKYDDLL